MATSKIGGSDVARKATAPRRPRMRRSMAPVMATANPARSRSKVLPLFTRAKAAISAFPTALPAATACARNLSTSPSAEEMSGLRLSAMGAAKSASSSRHAPRSRPSMPRNVAPMRFAPPMNFPKLPSMFKNRSMSVCAGTLPSETMAMSAPCATPSLSASASITGTPFSAICCRSSSMLTTPFALTWARAEPSSAASLVLMPTAPATSRMFF